MLTRGECCKTFTHFKCNIEIDLDFYVRARTCEKRVTGKQPEQSKRLRMRIFILSKRNWWRQIDLFNFI